MDAGRMQAPTVPDPQRWRVFHCHVGLPVEATSLKCEGYPLVN